MLESRLGKGYVSFDGSVFESWQPNNEGTGRLHAAVINSLNVMKQGKGMYFVEIETTYRNGPIAFSFNEEDLHVVEELKKQIEKAREKFIN